MWEVQIFGNDCNKSKLDSQTFWLESLKGRDHLGRPRHRWEGDIKMDLWEIDCWGCGLDLSVSEQGLVTGYCENSNERLGSTKGTEFIDSSVTINFSRRTLLHAVS
jgi:hypothetical protein